MNVVRPTSIRHLIRRTYSTAARDFVPNSNAADAKYLLPLVSRPKPESASFFTGAQNYIDSIVTLEAASNAARRSLQAAQILPLTPTLKAQLPIIPTAILKKDDMGARMGVTTLRPTQYKRVSKLLAELNQLRSVAEVSEQWNVAETLEDLIARYERPDKRAILDAKLRGTSRVKSQLDEHGRSYALGKRKTSSARVWIIPVKPAEAPSPSPTPTDPSSKWTAPALSSFNVPTTTILVNNLPLHEFFPTVTDREKVTRPLKLAGLLGKYNVFAITRGGGSTGQAEALRHGIAKALLPHAPPVAKILQKAKLTRRDPRMVERKKTGLAKARKAYTWVKR